MQFLQNYISEITRLCSLNNVLFVVLTFLAVYLVYEWLNPLKNIPPGPYGLPFVGYIPFLGDDPSKTLDELGKKYGSIFSLRLGPSLVIVLNDYEAMKEVLSDPNSLNRGETFEFFVNVGFQVFNGEEWIEQRRASFQIAKDLGVGKSEWENSVQEDVKRLTELLESQAGNPVDIDVELGKCIANNIFTLLLGRNLKGDAELNLVASYAACAFTEGSPADLKSQSTLWRKLVEYSHASDLNAKVDRVMSFQQLLDKEIKRHTSSRALEGKRDFINLYLEKMKQLNILKKKNYFSEHSLLGDMNIMFLGAVDTTHTSTIWLIRCMAKYPDILRKVQEEIDEVYGENGIVSFHDRGKLPYLSAVIMETLRYSSIVPLSSARSAVSEFKVRGYTIPKGAQITANLKKINFDPMYWDHPEEFRPERFLTSDGKGIITNLLSFAPFSYGRRNCPGERIFWMEALIYFTTICRHFTIQPPPGVDVSFAQEKGLLYKLKPQPLCFIKRNKQPHSK